MVRRKTYIFRIRRRRLLYRLIVGAAVAIPSLGVVLNILIALIFPNIWGLVDRDTSLGYRLRPNSRSLDWSPLVADRKIVRYAIGEEGQRAKEPGERLASTRPWVACVGDSNTFGIGVNFMETYPSQLSNRLPGVRVENFGVPGYNLNQVSDRALDVVAKWKPDLLIVQICGNDDEPEIQLSADPPWDWTRHSALTAFMYAFLRLHGSRSLEKPSPPASEAFERLVSGLADSGQHCLFIVLSPTPPSLNSEHARELIGRRSDLFAMIDVPWREDTSLHSSKHLNPDGNSEIASVIVRLPIVISITPTTSAQES